MINRLAWPDPVWWLRPVDAMALITDGPGPGASTRGLPAARLTEGPARERGQPLTLTILAADMQWFDECGNAIVVQVNESE